MKQKKGITLVALIITIVVLLVLAMVSINLVINSGIINKTKSAVDKYSEEEIGEQIKLAYLEHQMSKFNDVSSLEDILKRIFGDNNVQNVYMNNGKINVTINDKIYQYNINNGTSKLLNPQKLSSLTKDNYGDYLNLEKSIVGSGDTTDDWKIIYNDREEGKIYAILADYLPNSTGIAASTGLDTVNGKEYNVNVNKERPRTDLVNGFNSPIWKEKLLPGSLQGNSKIIVKGAIGIGKIIASYNEKHNSNLYLDESNNWRYLYLDREDTTKGLDPLYIPHQDIMSNCEGYWSYNIRASQGMWGVFYDGGVKNNPYYNTNFGILPVVILDSDIIVDAEKIGENTVWSIIE